MQMYNWEDLKVFYVYVEAKSLVEAARILHVDHVTVSRRISSLEKSLQIKLLDRRSPRSYDLTPEGQRVAEFVLKIKDTFYDIERFAKVQCNEVSGEVKINVPPIAAINLIAPHVFKLHDKYPDLVLHLISNTRNVSLLKREADIIVRHSRPSHDELVIKKLGVVTFSFYRAQTAATTKNKQLGYIAYDASMENSVQQQWLNQRRGDAPIILRSNDLLIQLAAVKSGMGIALLPDYLANKNPDLIALPQSEGPLERELWISCHKDIRSVPTIMTVMNFISDIVSEQL
ncbi:LysR family transcriptional regulator [Celerinatantimonas sp. YJH-8]|uniref:LysR family transcriptional regulator n=1 Tax=Celerinatantimonas sp. YJH-8 TaxID=3228714 RepID=UPI0038C435A1